MNDWKTCFRAPIHYIYNVPRPSCPASLLKNVISLAPIISIANNTLFVKFYALHKEFQQDDERNVPYVWNVRYVPYIPNVQDIPDNPAARFFRRRPYIPAPESWRLSPILRQRKVDSYRTSRRMKDIHIYMNVVNYIVPPFNPESVQPRNRRTRNQTEIRRTTRWGRPWAQYEAPSRLQMRL